ncbi:DEAD/DEAH box helicase [Apibacter muscae]|uniref:DEAD/DEAH box helicase n=1 Tax=Apibacter muscae TaxID=2509004 RepID=A0A563DGA0_9FLAO|nr:DEAD/DEAH box helicase [Apibacter muscae]TWP29157.1 DEAD/DEAH box helicase [Apibacter muscae]
MKPLLFQQEAAKGHLSAWKCGALFMEPGTSKTRIAVELVNRINNLDLVVWVTPLRLIEPQGHLPSTKDEIQKWGGFHCKNVIYIGVETISLSQVKYINLYQRIKNAKRVFIVVDESSKIKNLSAVRTQRVLSLGEMTPFKLILNGTPFSKNILDVYSQMNFLSPKILNMTAADFENIFCRKKRIIKYLGKWKQRKIYDREFITGFENIDLLYSMTRHYVYEYDLNLQIKQYWNNYNYVIGEQEKEEYYYLKNKYLDNERLLMLNNNIFLEMTQKMQHSYCISESKFEVLDKHFQSYPIDQHIIFCKYIKSREECLKRYPKATVLNYQSESMGLNLQHLPLVIFFDKIWDYALRVQGSRRSYRVGQEKDCRYFDLTGDVGLEKLINDNIAKKGVQMEYFKKLSKNELKEIL